MSEVNTYSSSPFISHDGPDEKGNRAEVRVVTGFGHVHDIEPSTNGKSNKVSFSVDNTKFKTSGWAPEDSGIIEKIRTAKENGEPIHFRVEVRRKDHIDRTLPMSEVAPPKDMNAARDNINKSLAAVKFEDDAEWSISKYAVTRIEEDPVTGGLHSAYEHSMEELKQAYRTDNMPPASPSHRNNNFENPPFRTLNSSGAINPGSIAVSIPISFYNFVSEWNRTHEDVELTEKHTIVLSKAMLVIANRLQKDIYGGEIEEDADRFALGSHTRARSLVFEVSRNFYPINNDTVSSNANLQKWIENVHSKALSMWKWSINEIEKILD